MYENIKSELAKYYFEELPNLADEHRAKGFEEMDKFAEQHEGASSYFLKAKMYDVIAENVNPQIFADIPFCFEFGTLRPMCDGRYDRGGKHANGWLIERNAHLSEKPTPKPMRNIKISTNILLSVEFLPILCIWEYQ